MVSPESERAVSQGRSVAPWRPIRSSAEAEQRLSWKERASFMQAAALLQQSCGSRHVRAVSPASPDPSSRLQRHVHAPSFGAWSRIYPCTRT